MVKEYLEDKKLMKSIISKYACDLGNIWEKSHMENFKLTIINKNNHRSIDFKKLKNDLKLILSRHEQDISKKNLIIKDNDSFNIQIRQILERLLVLEDIQKNSSQKGNRVISTEKSSEKSEDSVSSEGKAGSTILQIVLSRRL